MTPVRVLVIGASGFIGRHLARRLGPSPHHDVTGTHWSRPPGDDGASWHQLELTDAAALERLFAAAQPEVVVHLAAIADIGTAERDPARATAVNANATSTIASLCQQHAARLIFVSTECVFGGERGYYREDEPPHPTTHYGRTKFEAERVVAKLPTPWSIVRTSIVYGWPEPGRRNFAPWLVENLRDGRPYRAPTDVMRTPVYVGHLVDGISRLVDTSRPGILHVAGRDWVSMHDFARAIAETFRLDTSLVEPIGPDHRSPADAPARPDRLGLDCTKSMGRLALHHPGLAEGIAALQSDAPAR